MHDPTDQPIPAFDVPRSRLAQWPTETPYTRTRASRPRKGRVQPEPIGTILPRTLVEARRRQIEAGR